MCSGFEIDGVVIICDEVCVSDSDVMFFWWLIGSGVVIGVMETGFNIFDTSSTNLSWSKRCFCISLFCVSILCMLFASVSVSCCMPVTVLCN